MKDCAMRLVRSIAIGTAFAVLTVNTGERLLNHFIVYKITKFNERFAQEYNMEHRCNVEKSFTYLVFSVVYCTCGHHVMKYDKNEAMREFNKHLKKFSKSEIVK